MDGLRLTMLHYRVLGRKPRLGHLLRLFLL